MQSRLRLVRSVTPLLVAFVVCACASPVVELPAKDEVRVLMTKDPASLTMIGKPDKSGEQLASQLTDSLVRFGADLLLKPRLATSWSLSEDRRTLEFSLRRGVLWHDGTPFTSKDVAFTIEQVLDPGVESRTWSPWFSEIERLELVDDYTIRAHYEKPMGPDALEAWRVPLIPAHRAEAGAALLSGDFSQNPIGCGPFRFVHYRRGEEIVLDANPDYWDGRPSIGRLVFRIVPEERTAYQAMRIGELDLMVATPTLFREARGRADADGLDSFVYTRLGVWKVGWNQDGSNPFFDDPRVRDAMVRALDRESFVESVLHGLARPAITTYHPELWWADPRLAPKPYDPDKARAQLAEADWVDRDGDGVVERDGVDFRFQLMIVASSQPLTDQLAAWLKSSWREIGIETEIERLEWSFFRERRDRFDFQAEMSGFSLTPAPDQFELYHSKQRGVGSNHVGFGDAEADRLVELGRTELDADDRREVYFDLQRRLFELEPISCLFHFQSPVLVRKGLRGVTPSPLGLFATTEGPRSWSWDGPSGS